MNFDEYQKAARTTAIYPNLGNNPVYPALGLAGEAGEVCENIKKMIRDDGSELTDARRAAVVKELGDVLWYAAQLAMEIGVSLGAVAEANIAKLADRKRRDVIKGDGDDR